MVTEFAAVPNCCGPRHLPTWDFPTPNAGFFNTNGELEERFEA